MRRVLQLISWAAAIGTILPPFLFFYDRISLDQCKTAMLIATIAWFIATPLWMGRAPKAASSTGENQLPAGG
jgi:hypothetical protein